MSGSGRGPFDFLDIPGRRAVAAPLSAFHSAFIHSFIRCESGGGFLRANLFHVKVGGRRINKWLTSGVVLKAAASCVDLKGAGCLTSEVRVRRRPSNVLLLLSSALLSSPSLLSFLLLHFCDFSMSRRRRSGSKKRGNSDKDKRSVTTPRRWRDAASVTSTPAPLWSCRGKGKRTGGVPDIS